MMNMCRMMVNIAVLVVVGVMPMYAQNTWTGSGDWYANAGNWSGGLPTAGQNLIIAAGSSLQLTNSTPALASLTMQGGTLTCSNWTTAINATTVTINGGTLTCAGPFDDVSGVSNRVYVTCTDFFLASAASINVAEKGYAGGAGSANGNGPGKSLGGGATPGAGHGGLGGPHGNSSTNPQGAIYGVTNAPLEPGSGAGGWSGGGHGGHGGGAVCIAASGVVTINGSIIADGGVGNQSGVSGGGSGGSVYITCNTFAGSNGLVSVIGGTAGNHSWAPGGGAGGRIAVVYNYVAQGSLSTKPTVTFAADRGSAPVNVSQLGKSGTVYFPDNQGPAPSLKIQGGQLVSSNVPTAWSLQNLTVSGSVVLPVSVGLTLTGNLVLTNAGTLSVNAGPTNSMGPNYGALVSVGGDIVIYTNSWIYPVSDPTNGGSVRFTVSNLTVPTTNAGIDATAAGWWGAQPGAPTKNGWGPGSGLGGTSGTTDPQGGGYGGKGGYTVAPGNVYGTSNLPPVYPGSGGGAYDNASPYYAGNGGGLIWVEATGTITLNGSFRADGGSGYHISGVNSSGSGGGIYITCKTIAGTGDLSAKGAPGNSHAISAGGGGGRILVFRKVGDPLANVSVAGGANPHAGSDGSIYWGLIPAVGTTIRIQ
jgi:hypothetical protein